LLSISDLVASVLRPRAPLLRRIASGVLLLLLLSSSSYADFPVTVSTDYDAEFARAADLLEDGKRAEAEAILEAIRRGAKLPSWDARAALLLAVDDERHDRWTDAAARLSGLSAASIGLDAYRELRLSEALRAAVPAVDSAPAMASEYEPNRAVAANTAVAIAMPLVMALVVLPTASSSVRI